MCLHLLVLENNNWVSYLIFKYHLISFTFLRYFPCDFHDLPEVLFSLDLVTWFPWSVCFPFGPSFSVPFGDLFFSVHLIRSVSWASDPESVSLHIAPWFFTSMVLITSYVWLLPNILYRPRPLLDSGCLQMFWEHFKLTLIFSPKFVLPCVPSGEQKPQWSVSQAITPDCLSLHPRLAYITMSRWSHRLTPAPSPWPYPCHHLLLCALLCSPPRLQSCRLHSFSTSRVMFLKHTSKPHCLHTTFRGSP